MSKWAKRMAKVNWDEMSDGEAHFTAMFINLGYIAGHSKLEEARELVVDWACYLMHRYRRIAGPSAPYYRKLKHNIRTANMKLNQSWS